MMNWLMTSSHGPKNVQLKWKLHFTVILMSHTLGRHQLVNLFSSPMGSKRFIIWFIKTSHGPKQYVHEPRSGVVHSCIFHPEQCFEEHTHRAHSDLKTMFWWRGKILEGTTEKWNANLSGNVPSTTQQKISAHRLSELFVELSRDRFRAGPMATCSWNNSVK